MSVSHVIYVNIPSNEIFQRQQRILNLSIHDFTRFTWICLLENKSETREHLQIFINNVETRFGTKIKTIMTDNDKEFLMHDFYNKKGIVHYTSCIATPQQNRVVEWKHQHILNVAHALYFQVSILQGFWTFAIKHVVHLISKLPTSLLDNKSPHELLFGNVPNLSHLKIFGCLVYASTITVGQGKFYPHAIKCIFLGYKLGTKGFLLKPQTTVPSKQQTSQRTRRAQTCLKDFHIGFTVSSITNNSLDLGNTPYRLSYYLSYAKCSKFYSSFVLLFPPKLKLLHTKRLHNMNVGIEPWMLNYWLSRRIRLDHKWVYKIKYQADGSIKQYKACLVAKGYIQTMGVDYFETFTHYVEVLLALATAKGWYLHQLDINNAFLHGDLHEGVYMTLPPSISANKNLGLKQANRQWNANLTYSLLSLGYTQSNADHSPFVKHSHNLAGNDMVTRSRIGIILNQRKYCLELVGDFGLLGSKPIFLPINASYKLLDNDTIGDLLSDPSSYRHLVGRLLYMTTTFPNIAFATQQLSQFIARPSVICYLKGTPGLGLFFSAKNEISFIASLTQIGLVVLTLAASSQLINFLAFQKASHCISFICVIYIAQNPTFHERTKHTKIDCHVVRTKLQAGLIDLLPIISVDQLANVFTKPLLPCIFQIILSILGLLNIYVPTYGRLSQYRQSQ
ncbi:Copia protein, partial [Mucuna pruriens]